MPAVINHLAILLLARRRLAQIRRELRQKIANGSTVTDLEHRVAYLADKAHQLLSVAGDDNSGIEYPSGLSYGTPLGQGISPFAVMGSMGPDLTGFSAVLAPGSEWVFDTVHKGTPDGHREAVVARTTDLAIELWNQAKTAIERRTTDDPQQATALQNKKNADKAKMRAYVLGHLCHVMGDVISHPYVNDIEWHLKGEGREDFSHASTEAQMDARIAQQIFRRSGTRDGQSWGKWVPGTDQVPVEFYSAYERAFKETYYKNSVRPTGYGHFEKMFTDLGPPALSPDFVKDGYAFYKDAVLEMVYTWGYGRWWGFFLPMFIPLAALFPLAMALPAGRRFKDNSLDDLAQWYEDQERDDLDRAYFEVFMLPFAVTSVIPLFYGSWIAALTRHGVEGITWTGIVFSVLNVIAAITFFATLAVDDLPWWFRWLILFAIPAASGVGFFVEWLTNHREGRGRRKWLSLIYTLPFLISAAFALVYFLLVMLLPDTAGDVLYWILLVLVSGTALVMSFVAPALAKDARISDQPKPFPVDRRHYVRLFDDTTLHWDPAAASPAMDAKYFPSSSRELIRLWWQGSGEMFVRSRGTFIEFAFNENATDSQVQRVPAPIAPMTALEYIDFLNRTVEDDGGGTGDLHGALVYGNDLQYDLPPGATFAHETSFTKLETSSGDGNYKLRHAHKSAQAIRYQRTGPVPYRPGDNLTVRGEGSIRSIGTQVLGDKTLFRTLFNNGDQIRANGEVRMVTLVKSDSELVIASNFSSDLSPGTEYDRFGSTDEQSDGYSYVTDPTTQHLGGSTVMDYAADLSAMTLMGAVPHLVPDSELEVTSLRNKQSGGTAVDRNLTKVYQVFRNWNLDRRRVNEWRMLVTGGAVSEKGAAATEYDAAMYKYPTKPAGWDTRDAKFTVHAPEGEKVARERGWINVLRDWLNMTAHSAGHDFNGVDPVRKDADAGVSTNRELSRAIAFLFDMSDPVALD